jgi:GNAT superfamily N-acetyltransferase
MTDAVTAVRRVTDPTEGELTALVALLRDVVHAGASIGFMDPLSRDRAGTFWRGVAEGITRRERALLVAEDDGGLVGTVQLVLAQPDNQPHRADLAKMMVHPQARRRGIAAALLRAAETVAVDNGRTLLVLDTVTGSDAERLYTRCGWVRSGIVPGYALMPRGGLCSTTFLYRELDRRAAGRPQSA